MARSDTAPPRSGFAPLREAPFRQLRRMPVRDHTRVTDMDALTDTTRISHLRHVPARDARP